MEKSQQLGINTSLSAAAFGAIDEDGRLSEAHLGAKDAGLGSGGAFAVGEVARQSKQVVVDNLRAAHLALESAMFEHIGRIAHEVNRGYCHAIGDHSQVGWEDAPAWQIDAAIEQVRLTLANPKAGPEASHNSWMAQKIAEGWKWGEEKRPSLKLHPCIVPFDKLPVEQQAKDYIFRAVVLAIANAPDQDVDGSLHAAAEMLRADEALGAGRWPGPSFLELHPPASLPGLTPKQHVFLTLGNLIKLIDDGWDLERNRDQLKSSLENAASWEPLLANRSQEPSPGANHGTLSDQEDTDKP